MELRLQLARLAVARGGPQVAASLNELERKPRAVLEGGSSQATDRSGQGIRTGAGSKGARRLWALMADQEPGDVDVRLNLLDFAFELGDRGQIEGIIKQLEQIEGIEGSLASVCQARYLIWQADQALEKDPTGVPATFEPRLEYS